MRFGIDYLKDVSWIQSLSLSYWFFWPVAKMMAPHAPVQAWMECSHDNR